MTVYYYLQSQINKHTNYFTHTFTQVHSRTYTHTHTQTHTRTHTHTHLYGGPRSLAEECRRKGREGKKKKKKKREGKRKKRGGGGGDTEPGETEEEIIFQCLICFLFIRFCKEQHTSTPSSCETAVPSVNQCVIVKKHDVCLHTCGYTLTNMQTYTQADTVVVLMSTFLSLKLKLELLTHKQLIPLI